MPGIRAAHGRLHAFPVKPGVNPHPGTRRCFRRCPADGPERPGLTAVIIIRGGRIRGTDKQFPFPYRFGFPEFKGAAIRQKGGIILFHLCSP